MDTSGAEWVGTMRFLRHIEACVFPGLVISRKDTCILNSLTSCIHNPISYPVLMQRQSTVVTCGIGEMQRTYQKVSPELTTVLHCVAGFCHLKNDVL